MNEFEKWVEETYGSSNIGSVLASTGKTLEDLMREYESAVGGSSPPPPPEFERTREEYDAFAQWVIDTYGWLSWQYTNFPDYGTSWNEDPLYQEFVEAGSPGYTPTPDEKFGQPHPEDMPIGSYEDIIYGDFSDAVKYSLIKQHFPGRLIEWLTSEILVDTGMVDDKGNPIIIDVGGKQYVTDGPDSSFENGVYTLDGLEFVLDEFLNLKLKREEEEEEEVDDRVEVSPGLWQDPVTGKYSRKNEEDEVSKADGDKEVRDYVASLEEEDAIADTKIVSIGGYDYEINYDADGNELSRSLIGRTKEEEDLFPPDYIFNLAGYYTAPDGSFWINDDGVKRQITEEQKNILDELFAKDIDPGGLDPTYNVIVPGKLYQDPETELYYDQTGQPITDPDLIQRIIDDFESENDPPELTPAEEENIRLQEEALRLQAQQLAQQGRLEEARLAQEKAETIAGMLARPMSWLEYHAFTGTQAAVQPWGEELGMGEAGSALQGWGPDWQTQGGGQSGTPGYNPNQPYDPFAIPGYNFNQPYGRHNEPQGEIPGYTPNQQRVRVSTQDYVNQGLQDTLNSFTQNEDGSWTQTFPDGRSATIRFDENGVFVMGAGGIPSHYEAGSVFYDAYVNQFNGIQNGFYRNIDYWVNREHAINRGEIDPETNPWDEPTETPSVPPPEEPPPVDPTIPPEPPADPPTGTQRSSQIQGEDMYNRGIYSNRGYPPTTQQRTGFSNSWDSRSGTSAASHPWLSQGPYSPTPFQQPQTPTWGNAPVTSIPNYNPALLPTLLRPSAQYTGRMNPDELDQYYGYQQAKTGATPEKTRWNLWNTAPPSGQYRGLTYRR